MINKHKIRISNSYLSFYEIYYFVIKELEFRINDLFIDNNINLIGVGGIDSPESAWERICSGASLVQIYTGWIYKGPQLVPNILNGLIKQINIHQLSNLKEAIGSNLEWIE